MFALPSTADIFRRGPDVRFVPIADIVPGNPINQHLSIRPYGTQGKPSALLGNCLRFAGKPRPAKLFRPIPNGLLN
jgi:hypothetical protein